MTAATITLFANNTAPTGPELDNNFLAYAVFTTIPCTASGTNTITLTQNSNTPNLTQLTNYIQFSFVAVATNTGAVAITTGFGTLNAYKDSPAGPIALSGGEIILGNMVTARYDSALNSGSGGYHIYTNTAFAGGTLSGSLANLTLSGGTLAVIGGSVGASLTSSVFSGNSLSIVASGGSLGATLTSSLLTGNSLTVSGVLGNYAAASVGIGTISSLRLGVLGSTLATVTRMVSAIGTIAYTSIVPNTVQDQAFVVAGAQVNDAIVLGFPAAASGMGFCGFCGTIGTVTIRLTNPTAATTIAAATITVRAVAMGTTP